MASTERHAKSGQRFRININNGEGQAIGDRAHHGTSFRLLDWADRIEQDDSISAGKKRVALMFYAHRCHPEIEPTDTVSADSLNLEGVVYGISAVKWHGESRDQVVLVRESELESI